MSERFILRGTKWVRYGAPSIATISPAQILNIGPGATQNHFLLQLAADGAESITTKSQAELADGFSDPVHFRARDGYVVFSPRADGPTTDGTAFARDELRETNADGSNAKFNALQGTHILQGVTKIVSVPANDPDVVIAQLHDGGADRVAIRSQMFSTGVTVLGVRINGALHSTRFVPDWSPSDTSFAWKIVVENGGTVKVYYNDMSTPKIIADNVLVQTTHPDGWYWKVGAYNQFNESAAGATGQTVPATARSEVHLKSLSVSHSA